MMKPLCLFLLIPLVTFSTSTDLEYRYLEFPNNSFAGWITGSHGVHLIEVDPSLYEIRPVKALDNGIGRESVLSIATRYGATASVNGGFFSIGGTFDGRACGTLKILDWFALPFKPRGCLGWSRGQTVPKMDRLIIKINIDNNGELFSADGLNRPRRKGELVLFTPSFHKTTLTNPDGQEIVVVNGLIQDIVSGGSTKIPKDGLVVSIQETHSLFDTFTIGNSLLFSIEINPLLGSTSSYDWDDLDYIVGGTPLLLHPHAHILDFTAEKTIPTFLSRRHARTAIGILPNGNWLFVVVDRTSYFEGMTMDELVDLMSYLGCIYALNLDGGGSSTMVLRGAIINSPYGNEYEGCCEKPVRRVSDAIIIIPKSNLD